MSGMFLLGLTVAICFLAVRDALVRYLSTLEVSE